MIDSQNVDWTPFVVETPDFLVSVGPYADVYDANQISLIVIRRPAPAAGQGVA